MIDQKKEKLLSVKGVVTEALPSTLFRVEIQEKKEGEGDEAKEILAYLAG
jgi:translation initiation factor IF-1